MKRRLMAFALAIMAVVSVATPAYAIPLPDSTPQVIQINVYRNLEHTGDALFLIYANIPYATLPGVPVNEAFSWQLYDTDGVTLRMTTTGYAFAYSGWRYNLFSLYTSNITAFTGGWGVVYPLKLVGNPVAFASPPTYSYTVNVADYTLLTTQADNQAALATRILAIAHDLDVKWVLGAEYTLLEELEDTTVLSLYGAAFFRGAIYGLQGMAPSVFAFTTRDLNTPDRTWNPVYETALTDQWAGTWVATAKAAGAALFGTPYDLVSIMLVLSACGGILFGNLALTGDAWNGLIDVAVVLVFTAKLGLYGLGFLALVCALCFVYTNVKVWRPFG